MKLKRMFLLAAVVCSTFAAIAQSTMTDIQVLEYVKSGLAQGKSQEVMMRELAARGVDRAQAERVKEMYESQKTAVAQEIPPRWMTGPIPWRAKSTSHPKHFKRIPRGRWCMAAMFSATNR